MNPDEKPPVEPVLSPGLEFQKRRHEGWNTSAEAISGIIQEVFNSPIREKKKIVNGENNEVYDITTESGEEAIVRIHRESPRFQKERWAIERCAELGIPVPKVLLIKDIIDNGQALQVCVETKIPGHSLDKTPAEELPAVLLELGQILLKLHTIPTNGFGRLDKDGKGKFATSAELALGNKDILPAKLLPQLADKPEEQQIVARAYEILQREISKHSTAESYLAHNDIQPNHVLVKDGKISGLIDFESASGADPILDFALWDFKFGKKYPLSALGVECDQNKLNIWKVYRLLTSLDYCLENGKKHAVTRTVGQIQEVLERFK
jgi:aminoglycoside phosphotransferase (APT) family kinase protein